MKNEETIMLLILHGGNARSKALEAFAKARKGDFEVANNLLLEANEELKIAHESQTALIQLEARGETSGDSSLLMIHAQDHIMNAMTIRDIVKEMIKYMKENKR